MSIAILTAWYERPELAAILRESCEMHGVPLINCGEGNWPHDMRTGKLEATLKAIPMLRERGINLVVFCDAYDCFVTHNPFVIERRWRNELRRRPMVFSGEKNCWPDESRADRYPNSDSPWRFINAGTWLAQVDYLEDILTVVTSRVDPAERDDQRIWTEFYLEGSLPGAVVDTERVIFQTMWNTGVEECIDSVVYHHNGGVWRDGPGNKFEKHWELVKGRSA